MKKALIGTLGLGLVIGALGMNVFASNATYQAGYQGYVENPNQNIIRTNSSNTNQFSAQFETLDNTTKIETLDGGSLDSNNSRNNSQNDVNRNNGNQNYDNYRGYCNGPGSCRR